MMRAAIMRNRAIVVGEVATPVAGPMRALVRTVACGICGSDLHFLRHGEAVADLAREPGVTSHVDFGRDLVMGHEFCAELVEYGPGADGPARPGDLVVSMPIMFVGMPPGPETARAVGYSNDFPGGYGEMMALFAPLLLKVPNGLSARHAALTEPLAVGIHAVNRSGALDATGRPEADRSAIVHGCGPVGLAVIAALRLAGFGPIVAADFSPARRRLAELLGAHTIVDPARESAIEVWSRGNASANPAGLVQFEAVGVPTMIDKLMRAAPRYSRICVVGACMEPDTILPMIGINKELTMQFVLGYRPEEFATSLSHISDGRVDVSSWITGTVAIDGVAGAFAELGDPERHCKIIVEP